MIGKYGIRITHEKSMVGWVVGEDGDVLLFPTKQEAEKSLKQMKSNDRYSWNCNVEVAEFSGFGK